MTEQKQEEDIKLKAAEDETLSQPALISAPKQEDISLPEIAERFETISLIGTGGMSDVYKVRDKSSGNLFAAKILKGRLCSDEKTRQRFLQEASIIQQLEHTNIIKVIGSDITPEGAPYLLLEWLEGKTLAEEIAQGPLPFNKAQDVFSQMCKGLEYAHLKGIIHRDIKPSNVLLIKSEDRYDVKIMDFGIAKILGSEDTNKESFETESGAVLGSPAYMSPEQCLGETVDARSDIYSMGCLMYEALIGTNPFIANTPMGTILNHLEKDPEDLLSTDEFARKKIPSYFESTLLSCLSKKAALRYSSAYKLEEALFPPPGAISRVLASAIDISAIGCLYVILYELIWRQPVLADLIASNRDNYLLICLIAYTSYFSFFESIFGTTPGKLACNLRVRSLDGGKPSVFYSFARAASAFAILAVPPAAVKLKPYALAIDQTYSTSYYPILDSIGLLSFFTVAYLLACFFFVFGKKKQWHFDEFFNLKVVSKKASRACSIERDKFRIAPLAVASLSLLITMTMPLFSTFLLDKCWGDPQIPKIMNVASMSDQPRGEPLASSQLTLQPDTYTFSRDSYFHNPEELAGKKAKYYIRRGSFICRSDVSPEESAKSIEDYLYSAHEAELEGSLLDAQDGYQKAIALDPYSKLAWDGLTRVYEKYGDRKKAKEAQKKAADCPTLSATQIAASLVQLDLAERAAEAVSVCTHALKTDPNNPELLQSLAKAYGQLGARLKQEKTLKQILQVVPNEPWALLELDQLKEENHEQKGVK